MDENLRFRPQLTAAATLLHLLADSLQCGTEEKCVLELRRKSIALQDKKSPEISAWLAVGPADGDPSALSWLGPALLLLSRLSLPCPSSGVFARHGFSRRDRQANDRNGNY